MLRPSGVSSASDASCAASASCSSGNPWAGDELGGLAGAERDGARLVEEQDIDVAGRLDGPARHGDDVRLDHPVHAGDPDRRAESADRRRDQAHRRATTTVMLIGSPGRPSAPL